MSNKILFVDDESFILNTIKRQFRNSEYELLFANGGEEALQILKENRISVIVSDMRMPEMDGARFLELSQEICPYCIKMVLSGHAEIDTVLSSINRGNIWRFITKPWEKEELKIAIDNAIELYESKMREKRLIADLQKKTEELSELNQNLDKKVKERTWLITERSEILNMLIQEPETDKVIEKICKTLATIIKQDVYISIQGCLYSNKLAVKHNTNFNDPYIKYIYKDKKEVAQLIIKEKPSNIDDIDDIIPLIQLVAQYKLLLDNSADVLTTIESYMDKL